MTKEGDVVLVYIEHKPAFFARIESIDPDIKPHWFRVKMLVLQVPLIVVTWILREPYINGEEFTMGGRPIKIVEVVAPQEEDPGEAYKYESDPALVEEKPKKASRREKTGSKIISLEKKRPKDN